VLAAEIVRAGIAENGFEATAIVQHYSSELGVSTWLLDVTASPWVALFFASHGGRTGDIGTLEYIERTEWTLFSNDGQSALGAILVASPKSAPRIHNQQAFFLQAPHPKLLHELVNRRLYFRQKEDVVFESEAFEPQINHDLIYPSRDPTLAALRGLATSSLEAKPLEWEPTTSVFHAPDWTTYLPIASALLERELKRGSAHLRRWDGDDGNTLSELCRLHAAVHAHREDLPNHLTTLHHLRRLVTSAPLIKEAGMSDFLNFLYLSHCDDGDTKARQAFEQCLLEASPFWRRSELIFKRFTA